jgi:hypothetical protein
MITREALRVLTAELHFTNNVNHGYDDEFGRKGAKVGQTINIRKPARYLGRTGPTLSPESQNETWVPLVLNQQYGVDTTFTSAERSLSLDDIVARVVKPAMIQIANRVDAYGIGLWKQIYNQVGTPGTAITGGSAGTAIQTMLNAGVVLDRTLAPRDGERCLVLDPQTQSTLTSNGLNLFNPSSTISEQYKTGQITEALGYGIYMDQNSIGFTNGTYAGSPVVTAAQSGASVATTGWTSASLSFVGGEVFTMAGVFAVNPQTKAVLPVLQQFVVMAPVVDTTGAATISISPAIIATGSLQNVSNLPGATIPAAIVVSGATGAATQLSMAFHKDAFVIGTGALEVPRGIHSGAVETDPETGLSIRLLEVYDPVRDLMICRTDILFGFSTLYEQLACRVATS